MERMNDERNDSGTEVTGLYARLTYLIASLRSFPILATPCHRPASRSLRSRFAFRRLRLARMVMNGERR